MNTHAFLARRLARVALPVALAALSAGFFPLLAQEPEGIAVTDLLRKKESENLSAIDKILSRVRLSGMFQAGYSAGFGPASPVAVFPGEGANDFAIHRLLLIVNAEVTDRLTVTYNGNFAGGFTNLEYYATYRFAPEFQVLLGQKKTPFLMDNQLSPASSELIATGSFLTNYFAAGDASNPLTGAWAGRDLGLEVRGDLFGNLLTYRLALYNGQGINTRDKDRNKALSGSLSLRPLPGLEVNGSFYTGKATANGTALFEAGDKVVSPGELYRRDRWSAGVSYQKNRFGIRSEYMGGYDDLVRSDGVYVTSWGRLFRDVDLILSYAYGDFNRTGANPLTVHNAAAGLQWWFLPKCRLRLEYNALIPTGSGTPHPNHSLQTQLQFAF